MNSTDLAWAAGIIDGEGCISVNYGTKGWKSHKKSRCVIKINVSNTDPRMPLRMKTIFGLGSVCVGRKSTENRMALYEWTVVSRQAVTVLREVLPYLVIKSEQANLAFAIAETIQTTGGRVALEEPVVNRRLELQSQLRALKNIRPTLEEVS